MYFLSYLNYGPIYAISVCSLTDQFVVQKGAISVCSLTDQFVQKGDTLWVFGRRNASQNNFWIFTEQPTNTRRMNLPTGNLQEMFLFLGDDRGAAY